MGFFDFFRRRARADRNKTPKVLFLVWYEPAAPAAVIKHIESMAQLSRFPFTIYNTYEAMLRRRASPTEKPIDLRAFDVLVVHNTVSYSTQTIYTVEKVLGFSIKSFRGVKVLMKQDEMRRVNETKRLLQRYKFDLLLTCLKPSEFAKVYGEKCSFDSLQVFTGYIDDEMKGIAVKPLSERKTDVFYRGMETPFEWGQLGREKYEISGRFLAATEGYGLRCDISSLNQDRIYGPEWLERLRSSRACLAVESGASIFDFDGSIENWCKEFREKFPLKTFADAEAEYLQQFEGLVHYNQISPRHLEAAATGTVMIMYEGEYSGIFETDIHYILLKKDFSNIEEVVAKLRDDAFCLKLIENCRQLILTDERLQISSMVKSVNDAIERRLMAQH